MEATLPKNEQQRLEALRQYSILDTPQEADFDELVRLAAYICKTPISLVSLVDQNRQWFKGRYGLDVSETPRRLSFCAHAILQSPQPLIVEDATKDIRFSDNELVTGELGIRFYAGAPLITPDGYPLGTLCVIDTKERTITNEQKEALKILSHQVIMQLELRRNLVEVRRAAQQLAEAHDVEHSRQEALVAERTRDLAHANLGLREKEAFSSQIVSSIEEGLVVLDMELKCLIWNRFMEEVSGARAEQALGHRPEELFPHLKTEGVLPLLQHALGGEMVRTPDILLRSPATGQSSWVTGRVGPLRDWQGHIIGVLASVQDITERKLMEQKLREGEERLSLAIDAAKLGTWDWNLETGQLIWSERCFTLFGLKPQAQMTYERFFEAVHPQDRERVDKAIQSALETCEDYTAEMRTTWPDGSEHWIAVRGRVYSGPNTKRARMSGAAFDITERVRNEEEARRWQGVFEAADFGLAYGDAKTNAFIDVNRSFARQRGYTPEELKGMPLYSVNPPEVREAMDHTIMEVDHLGHLVYESVHQRKDGSRFPVLMEVTAIRNAQGEPISRVAYALDITEIVAAREALDRSHQELERLVCHRTAQLIEANSNLQSFAHTAAHDLRAPLRAISGFTQAAIEDGGSTMDPETRLLLERVVKTAEQMGVLLDDLLEYSKISEAELKLGKVNLDSAVREAIALQQREINEKKAIVEVSLGMPEILGHEASIVLLINNLISNALKFVPPGTLPLVRVWAENSAGKVRLHVQDNGIGIAPEHLPKVFGTFQRFQSKQAYPGTGLGLAIVKKAAERMGGNVGLKSELGKGSCFWVDFNVLS